jgi:hypothetical protein
MLKTPAFDLSILVPVVKLDNMPELAYSRAGI